MAMPTLNNVLMGPTDDKGIPCEALGKLLFERMKTVDSNKVVMVNANTEASITNGELLKQSIKLSMALRKFGLKKGDVITIVSENTVNFAVPVLAAFYLGAIVNPLNPDYTKDELKRALNISMPKIVFCSKAVQDNVLQIYEKFIHIERVITFGESSTFRDVKSSVECFNGIDVDVDSFEPIKVKPDDIALILCSSGTTGFPKGVMLPHLCLRHYIITMSDPSFGYVTPDSVLLIVPPLFHLIGFMQMCLSLYYSTKCVLMAKFKPDVFLNAIQEHKATFMLLVPTLMNFLSKSPLVDKYDLSSIRDINWGGASMSKDVEAAVKKRLNLSRVRQAYGTTELGTVGTIQTNLDKSGSAGRLTFGFLGKVCNPETNETLGPNEIGELRFKNPCCMKGYAKNPEATAEAFDEDGFIKTGDAGYYDEEGDFYIVDRFKELIKYKAFQVPPAEIEAILLSHPAVKEAAVVGRPDERAGELPVAFVVRQDDKFVTAKELVDLVAANISIQKRLYGGVVFVEDLPKNKTGKILRRELKEFAKTLNDI